MAYFDCYRHSTFTFFTFKGPPLSDHLVCSIILQKSDIPSFTRSDLCVNEKSGRQHSARLYLYMCTFCAFMRAVITTTIGASISLFHRKVQISLDSIQGGREKLVPWICETFHLSFQNMVHLKKIMSKPNQLTKMLELFCLSRGRALYIDFLQLQQLPNRVRGGVLSTRSSLKFQDAAVVACLQRRIEARSHAAGDWPPSSLQTDNSNDRLR